MELTLGDLFNLCSVNQDVELFVDSYHVQGNCDTLNDLLINAVLDSIVTNIEADGDVLKVWLNDKED